MPDLSFVTADDHGHPAHVETLVGNAAQARLELLVEGVKVLRGDGTDVDGQVHVGCAGVLPEVDVRAVSSQKSVSYPCVWRTYHRGFSISTNSLLSGATGDEVR